MAQNKHKIGTRSYHVIDRATCERVPPHVIGQDDDGSPVVVLPYRYALVGADYWLDEDANAHVVVVP